MCGIVGKLTKNKFHINSSLIEKMCNTLIHRGPDDGDVWVDKEHGIGLGHRRLSVIDLSASANQPMVYNDLIIVFNGEIYNYLEIKDILIQKGFSFDTKSDTEVILKAYKYWGVDALQWFDGMFAFAIWDKSKNELFCARDRFGEKPFYYFSTSSQFMFASEMKALWAVGAPKNLKESAIYAYLNLGLVSNFQEPTTTFFEEIHTLLPGHYIKLSLNNMSVRQVKYWAIDLNKKNTTISFEDACDQFSQLFYTSLKRRLRTDVPIGTSLSGGLDSSAIVCAGKRLSNSDFLTNCFSARFLNSELDEGKYMKEVVDFTGSSWHEVYPTVTGFIEDFSKLIFHQEEPILSTSMYAQWLVYKTAKQKGVTVMLDGQGADEYIAGYDYYLDNYLYEVYKNEGKLSMQNILSQFKEHNEISIPKSKEKEIVLKSNIGQLINKIQKIKHGVVGFSQNNTIHPDFHIAHKKDNYFFPFHNNLNSALDFSTNHLGLNKLLRFADRNAMAHAVEVRLPFLNHELVEFVFSLPPSYKIHRGWTKGILRFSLQKDMPKSIVWRKNKLGYAGPQDAWLEDKRFVEFGQDLQSIAVKEKYITNDALSWKGIVLGGFLEMIKK